MGFLDHSTNNIIIDAVLTDVGRQKLADNNGSFNIAFFSLGDDEVDYGLIPQYGRTVGKEKISKNTPIFEAQTSSNIALKYRLLTLPDQTVVYLPNFVVTGQGYTTTANTLSFTQGTNPQRSITISQQVVGQTNVPPGTADVTFTVLLPDRFLQLVNVPSVYVDPTSRVATYSIIKNATSAGATAGGTSTDITVAVRPLTTTDFTTYGNGTTITSVLSIIGDASGIRKDITFTITA